MNIGIGFWGHGGRRRRFKRGMLRWVVLKVLDEGERHGYDFMRFFQTRGWSPGPGSIYPLLASLESEGLVQGRDEAGRRVYTITDEGRRVLREEAPRWLEFGDIFQSEEQPVNDEAQGAFDRLAAAWTQARQVAKPETIEQIVEIINEARKDIYSALADE
jgi:DNA-binding PadR family transcriptional regulator